MSRVKHFPANLSHIGSHSPDLIHSPKLLNSIHLYQSLPLSYEFLLIFSRSTFLNLPSQQGSHTISQILWLFEITNLYRILKIELLFSRSFVHFRDRQSQVQAARTQSSVANFGRLLWFWAVSPISTWRDLFHRFSRVKIYTIFQIYFRLIVW